MYDSLQGTLIYISPTTVTLDVDGVGYKVHVPISLPGKLTLGAKSFLYITFVVREDAHTLFGFIDLKERELFEELIKISGIGPKTALCLIGHLPPPDFYAALHKAHLPSFIKVPGIGKKTAERLILELKGKIAITSSNPTFERKEDAIKALLNLGYSLKEAQKSVEQALESHPDQDLSSLILRALKK